MKPGLPQAVTVPVGSGLPGDGFSLTRTCPEAAVKAMVWVHHAGSAHRARNLRPPDCGDLTTAPVTDLASARIRRHKVLGELINEYEQAATVSSPAITLQFRGHVMARNPTGLSRSRPPGRARGE
jgi:hypothetical protein